MTQRTQKTGAQALIAGLEAEGVDVIFGYPGGNALALYDALYDSKTLRHILVRHEQGAVHAADGYARATGRPGVVLVTSGPGATNTVTGIATAYMDSVPLVVITGQVPTDQIGTDAFQESDITGITLPIVKHSYLVKDVQELPKAIHEAFHIATTGRQGPVLIDIPADIAAARFEFDYPQAAPTIVAYKPTYKGNARQVKQAVDLILEARQPVLYAGGGVVASGAYRELKDLAELLQIPVACTLMARGSFPPDHVLFLGQPGIHGARSTNLAFNDADLIIAVGARFSDRVTGAPESFAPHAKVIHIDIDPAEIGKNHEVTIPIVGDAKMVLGAILAGAQKREPIPQTVDWIARIAAWRREFPFDDAASDKAILPEVLMHGLDEQLRLHIAGGLGGSDDPTAGTTADETEDSAVPAPTTSTSARKVIITTEVGQHQMWACQYLKTAAPRSFLTSGGLGTMGFGLPAALGAQVAEPDALVICIAGDGSLQMNSQEMATAAAYGLPLKVLLVDNACLGMVHQLQELFYHGRYSQTELPVNPDFVKLAEAYGWQGARVSDPAQLSFALRALIESDGPALLDVVLPIEELVLPMTEPDAPLCTMIDSGSRPPNAYRYTKKKGEAR